MSSTRATKSGINRDIMEKTRAKFDPELASQLLEWINTCSEQTLDTDGSIENFMSQLKNGVALCKLANSMSPGACKYNEKTTMAFKLMENINNFLNFLENTAGVPQAESFVTVDLWEEQNPYCVQMAIFALARKGEKFGKPSLGPKEATAQPRQWTEEQLKAGENIPTLQMGHTSGTANQSGMKAFGARRFIMD